MWWTGCFILTIWVHCTRTNFVWVSWGMVSLDHISYTRNLAFSKCTIAVCEFRGRCQTFLSTLLRETSIMLMLLQESFHREEPYKDRQNALSNFVFTKGSTPVNVCNMQLDLRTRSLEAQRMSSQSSISYCKIWPKWTTEFKKGSKVPQNEWEFGETINRRLSPKTNKLSLDGLNLKPCESANCSEM